MSEQVLIQELLTSEGVVFALKKDGIEYDYGMPTEDEEMGMEYEHEMSDLNMRQEAQCTSNSWIVATYGKFDQSAEPNGSHYMAGSANPFKKEGLQCSSCEAFCAGNKCHWVSGSIDPLGLCKLWVIGATNLSITKKDSTKKNLDSVIKGMKEGDFVSWDNVGGIARGRITHIMREGTLGVPESSFKIKADPDDPAVLIQLYRKNSDGEYVEQNQFVGHKMSELRSIQSLEKAEGFTPPASVQAAGKRAVEWISQGLNGDGFTSVGRLRAKQLASGQALTEETVRRMANYLDRHEKDKQAEGFSQGEKGFPRPGRVAWDAWGGDAGKTWAQGIVDKLNKKDIMKAVDEKRFTLAPWYVPNTLDAHNEWTDPEELQKALWDYVKSGNRNIRLQHMPDTVAGAWVEAMTWPFQVEVPMMNLEEGTVQKRAFPENTVFLGVQWEPWAWDLVKAGKIRGFSIGGKAGRLTEDLYAELDKSVGETVSKIPVEYLTTDVDTDIVVDMEKGDKAGHQFRGNQHTKGGAGGSADSAASAEAKNMAQTKENASQSADAAYDDVSTIMENNPLNNNDQMAMDDIQLDVGSIGNAVDRSNKTNLYTQQERAERKLISAEGRARDIQNPNVRRRVEGTLDALSNNLMDFMDLGN